MNAAAAGMVGLNTVVYRWTAVLLVFVVYSLVLFVGACHYGASAEADRHAAADARDDRAQLQTDIAEIRRRELLNANSAAQAAIAAATDQQVYLTLRAGVPHVSEIALVQRDGRCTAEFSDAWVRAWNDALFASAAGTARGSAGATSGTDPAAVPGRSR